MTIGIFNSVYELRLEIFLSRKHKIKQGECIATVAFAHGFAPETIWEHAENAELRAHRENGYTLAPGDDLHIPDKEPRSEDRQADKRHRFRRLDVPETLNIQLVDIHDKPRVGVAYELDVDGKIDTGKTDGDGWIRQKVAPAAKQGTLSLETEEIFELELSHLGPHDDLAGMQRRLENLGFLCGDDPEGELGEDTQLAMERFLDEDADDDKTWDDATLKSIGQSLRDNHGS